MYIIDVYSNEVERKARSSTDVSYVKIIAFDEANKEVPAEDVKRSVWHSLSSGCRRKLLMSWSGQVLIKEQFS